MVNGNLIVVSAPSGGGKSTLVREVLKRVDGVSYSVSLTTRLPRVGEKNGREYIFVKEEEFRKKKKAGAFIEYAYVHGYWYGTPKSFVENKLKTGRDVLFDIDVQGGRQIKRIFPDAVLIFVAPPSLKVLESRLRGRGQDNEADIKRRLWAVRREYASAVNDYDYLVVNDRIPRAFGRIESIIMSERLRMKHRKFFLKGR